MRHQLIDIFLQTRMNLQMVEVPNCYQFHQIQDTIPRMLKKLNRITRLPHRELQNERLILILKKVTLKVERNNVNHNGSARFPYQVKRAVSGKLQTLQKQLANLASREGISSFAVLWQPRIFCCCCSHWIFRYQYTCRL